MPENPNENISEDSTPATRGAEETPAGTISQIKLPNGSLYNIGATDSDHADTATTAEYATEAGTAATATTAGSADSATTAGSADYATEAGHAGSADTATTASSASQSAKLTTKRTIDGVEFDGTSNIVHFGVCSTAGATAVKEVTLPTGTTYPSTITSGSVVVVKFSYANTADLSSLKLKVGTDESLIYYRGANLPSNFNIKANSVYAFVYDSPRWNIVGDFDTAYDFYAYCSTTASTGTKQVTIDGFKQVTGSMIAINFKYTNTADPSNLKLQVNSETAKQIRYKNTSLAEAGLIVKDKMYFLVYDGYGWQVVGDLDNNVLINLKEPTTSTGEYYPTLATGAGRLSLNVFDSFKYKHTKGTSSSIGEAMITLGNSTASGTASNEEGIVNLYSSGTKKHTIKGSSITSADVTHTLPTKSGTVLNTGTTSYTQTVASTDTNAYEIGKIKINDSETTIYGVYESNTDTKVTQSNSTGNTNRPLMLSHDGTGTTSDVTDILYRNASMYGNPSTGTIYGNAFYANDGDVTIKRSSSIANNYPASLKFVSYQTDTPRTTSQASINVYDDHHPTTVSASGQNMVIHSGGNMVIGSGESPNLLYSTYINILDDQQQVSTMDYSEHLWLTSDKTIRFNVGFDDNPGQSVSGADSIQYIMSKNSFYQNMVNSSSNNEGFGNIGTTDYRWNAGNFHHLNVVTGLHCNAYYNDSTTGSFPMIYVNADKNIWIGARYATDTASYPAAHHPGRLYISSGWDTTNNAGYDTIRIGVPYATTSNNTTTYSANIYDILHTGMMYANITTSTDAWSTIGIPLTYESSSTPGFTLKVIRGGAGTSAPTPPAWAGEKYGNGIVFGSYDSKGIMSIAAGTPSITFAGGHSNSQNTKPEWYIKLTGTNGATYNLDISKKFSTTSNGQDNGWSTIVTANGISKLQDSVTSSLYVTRHTPVSGTTAYDPPPWYAAKYSVGLMFAHQNQVAIMSMASNNSNPLIKFGATGGGPNGISVADGIGPASPGTGVGWYFGLTGTTATTYNLDNFLTAHPATSNYSSETTESKEAFSASPVVNTLESFSFDSISSMTRDSFGHVSAEKKTTYTYAPLRRFMYQNTTKNNTWAGIGLEPSKYFLSIVRTGWGNLSGQKSPDWAPRTTHATAIAVSAGNQKAYIGLNSGSSQYPEVAFAAGSIASDEADPSSVVPSWYFKLLGTSESIYTLSNMVESIATTGSGNAITSVTLSGVTNAGSKLTFTKGTTFSTTDQNVLQKYNNGTTDAEYSVLMSGDPGVNTSNFTGATFKHNYLLYNPKESRLTVKNIMVSDFVSTSEHIEPGVQATISVSTTNDVDHLLSIGESKWNNGVHVVPAQNEKGSLGHSSFKWYASYIKTMYGELNGTISSGTTAVTQTSSDNSTKIATTAFVQNNKIGLTIDGVGNGVSSVTKSGDTITVTKTTFLTQHPSITTSSEEVSTSLYFGNIADNLNKLIKTTFTAASFNGSSTATTVDSNGHVTKLEKTTYTYGPLQCYVYKNATKNNTWNAVGMSSSTYSLYIHRYGYSTGTNTNPDWAPTNTHGTGIGISCGTQRGFIGFNSGSSTAPEVSFAAGACSDGATTKEPDWYFKLTGATGVSYNLNAIRTNQAPQVLNQATSALCIPFFNKTLGNMTASEQVYYTTGFCTQYRSGQSSSSPTTETDGCNILALGNNTTSGTAGNAFGAVCMYSRLTQPIQLRPNQTSSWVNIALPAKSTSSVVMSQIIMYTYSSGTKSNTCTSAAYSSQEFAYFKVFIENSTGSCFCNYDVIYNGSTTLNEFGLVWGKTLTGDGTTKCSTIMITVSKSSNKYTFTATTAPGYQGSTSVTAPTVYITKVIGVICQPYDP